LDKIPLIDMDVAQQEHIVGIINDKIAGEKIKIDSKGLKREKKYEHLLGDFYRRLSLKGKFDGKDVINFDGKYQNYEKDNNVDNMTQNASELLDEILDLEENILHND
jgi:hypothetical protein